MSSSMMRDRCASPSMRFFSVHIHVLNTSLCRRIKSIGTYLISGRPMWPRKAPRMPSQADRVASRWLSKEKVFYNFHKLTYLLFHSHINGRCCEPQHCVFRKLATKITFNTYLPTWLSLPFLTSIESSAIPHRCIPWALSALGSMLV